VKRQFKRKQPAFPQARARVRAAALGQTIILASLGSVETFMTNQHDGADKQDASTPAAAVRPPPIAPTRLVEPWQALKMNFAVLLSVSQKDAVWLDRLRTMAVPMRQLAAQDPDVALYMMLQTAMHDVEHYSAHHAMFCAVVADLCANWMEWPEAETESLFHAALTMNLGMLALQDSLTKQAGGLSGDQKKRIAEHPAQSAEMLVSAGVTDTLWLDIVRRHHQPVREGEATEPLQPAQKLAQLLQRVDVFTAKLSMRKTREAASATMAARDACLDTSGLPDAIGATMLRILGLYPPGSYVRLTNGELAVVTRRGTKAHTPLVVSLRSRDGTMLSKLQIKDTSNPAHGVQRVLLARDLKIVLNHERVLGV
jgi:hypothetical protein